VSVFIALEPTVRPIIGSNGNRLVVTNNDLLETVTEFIIYLMIFQVKHVQSKRSVLAGCTWCCFAVMMFGWLRLI
jgi:hypothetical protein